MHENQHLKLFAQRDFSIYLTTPRKLVFVLKTIRHTLATIIDSVRKTLNLIDLAVRGHVKPIQNANIGHLASHLLQEKKACVI